MAVAREDDHLGRARDGGLEAIARIPVPAFGRDRHRTGQDEELRDERAPRGHDERVRPQDVEHPGPRQGRDALRDGPDARGQPRREPGGLGLVTGQGAEAGDQVEDVVETGWIDDVDGNLEAVELGEHRLAIARAGRDHQVRLEGHDRLEARRDHPAHARLLPGLGRVVAEVGDADEDVLRADREEDLGHAGDERDDPARRRRQRERAAGLIA